MALSNTQLAVPLFGVSEAKDRELQKKLLANLGLKRDVGGEEAPVFGVPEAKDKEMQKRILASIGVKRDATITTGSSEDGSLLTAMAGRLRRAETELSTFKEELRRKDKVFYPDHANKPHFSQGAVGSEG